MTEPIISINVTKKLTVDFYENFLTYKDTHVDYKDLRGMSYLLTRTSHSINFIPTGTSIDFKIQLMTNDQTYVISSQETSFVFNTKSKAEKEEIFGKLVYVIDILIKPLVVANLLTNYAKYGQLILGDSLTISPQGFYKKRMFRSPDFLPWNQYYNSALSQGSFYIYKKKNTEKKYATFFSCSMNVINASVMPEVLNFLFQKGGRIDVGTISELGKANAEPISPERESSKTIQQEDSFCGSCGNPIEGGAKFCPHCGSKLK